MERDEVMALAEAAALFMRRLVADGVPMDAALELTATFVSSRILQGDEVPKDGMREPWELGES